MAKRKTKPKPEANPVGRPTLYKGEETCELAYKLGLLGATESQMAEIMGIAQSTLSLWKEEHEEFSESIHRAKGIADSEVAKSMYQRACGYQHPETKAQWVSDENGGRWEYAELVKQYPPDYQSASLWLRNRQPKLWRDKQEHEHSVNASSVLQALAGVNPAIAERVKSILAEEEK